MQFAGHVAGIRCSITRYIVEHLKEKPWEKPEAVGLSNNGLAKASPLLPSVKAISPTGGIVARFNRAVDGTELLPSLVFELGRQSKPLSGQTQLTILEPCPDMGQSLLMLLNNLHLQNLQAFTVPTHGCR
jgi:hypothetical protein